MKMKLVLSLPFIWTTAAQLKTLNGHSSDIWSVSVNGDNLFSGYGDGTVRQWNISTGNPIRVFTGHSSRVYSLEVSGAFLYSGSNDQTIGQWNISSGDLIRTFTGHNDTVRSLAVIGSRLYSGSYDTTIQQWSITSGELVRKFTGHADYVMSLAVNDYFLFSGSADGTLIQWTLGSTRLFRTINAHVNSSIFSVDANVDFVFSGSADQTIRQWSDTTGALIRTFTGHSGSVRSVAIRGDYLYSGSDDRTIRQWSISTGGLIRSFTGHTDIIRSITVASNFLFSGSDDGTIKQWCASNTYQNGTECLKCPTDAICSVNSFTCNSRYIASNGSCFFTSTIVTTPTATKCTTTDCSQQQPDNALSNMITYIAVGGTVLVIIALVGIFTTSLYYGKWKASQQRLRSTEALTNRRMKIPSSPSVFGGQSYLNEMSIRKIFPTYNSSVVNNVANPLDIMADISSVANITQPKQWNNQQLDTTTWTKAGSSTQLKQWNNQQLVTTTWTKTAPSSNDTTTIVAETHKGLYIPGNFLLRSDVALFRPQSKVLHSNRNCHVECYHVLDRELRQRCRTDLVAVKTLHGMNQNNLTCFYQEISIMYYFHGKPNIAQLVGFCDSPYQVLTDYYSMGSLEQVLLLDGPLIQPSRLVAIQFSLQISGALEQMHQNGFSHSDIKALNVFVDRDSDRDPDHGDALQCYLGDFGLAQILDDTHLVVKSYRVFNRKGLTVAYAAPEMFKCFRDSDDTKDWKAGDFLRADIYSLGVLLYEIVCCLGAWK